MYLLELVSKSLSFPWRGSILLRFFGISSSLSSYSDSKLSSQMMWLNTSLVWPAQGLWRTSLCCLSHSLSTSEGSPRAPSGPSLPPPMLSSHGTCFCLTELGYQWQARVSAWVNITPNAPVLEQKKFVIKYSKIRDFRNDSYKNEV